MIKGHLVFIFPQNNFNVVFCTRNGDFRLKQMMKWRDYLDLYLPFKNRKFCLEFSYAEFCLLFSFPSLFCG